MISSYVFGGVCLLIVLCMVVYTIKKYWEFKNEYKSNK